ncbi:lamin tail-like protein [Acetivibrio thermocellus AD2]|jgi:hypothetical protein|uniref:Lamin tail-like protein n=2 Tax=Acetivibrio thermocellus TaxID=1515 RepID=A0AB36TJW7_ACETH|nr:CotH kinase family protein [Acetivibrio thermocellus]ADU75796.1 Spore coat protein CotH [Acetivibrio thermocellus DSM 1313]ALX09828.1 Spore coat protein CotH [Acetivibrio thermocellus AD2]ANV77602.1 Spore coat protein CotH [Acetivibrio thermocellus DSM 2360]EIC03657.1 Spore coat protein CotH [Acetivibrio thermocellus YS]PFH04113.1 lamin tail-like protein [Acetivibrio thermocellus AD2]
MVTKRRIVTIVFSLLISVAFFTGGLYLNSSIHQFEEYQTVEATEKEYGYTIYVCKHCGKVKMDDYVEPTSYLLPNIVINEVCSVNNSFLPDENGDCYDWIELYNPTDRVINLMGFGLSDKKTDLFRYTFGDVEIKPKEYLLVYAVGDEVIESSETDRIYANFKLTSQGESVFLTLPNGKIIDKVTYPELNSDESYSRFEVNNTVTYKITKGTPMEENREFIAVQPPVFSADSGFYSEPFMLTLTAEPGMEIYYTLDSTDPNMNSIKYEGPILIKDATPNENVYRLKRDTTTQKEKFPEELVDKATIVRAVAYDKNGNCSEIVTKSYFVGLDKYKNTNVVSLVTDPANLFDEEIGIYVKGKEYKQWELSGKAAEEPLLNWDKRGFLWERPAEVAYFDKGNLVFEQRLGIRIRGASNRDRQMKSFNVFARKFYNGQNRLLTPLFEELSSQKSFILRACDYKEGFLQSLVGDRNVSTQLAKPCILFIDGEYWGEYQILERYSTHYIEEHFGVNRDYVSMVKAGKLESGSETSLNDYNNLLAFIKNNDMSEKENYDYVCERIDIQSLIDCYCSQIYLNNVDFAYNKNVQIWRTETKSNNPYEDGKWRWMLFDMDACIKNNWKNLERFYDFNTFIGDFPYTNEIYEDPFIANLMKNKDFCKQFVNTFMDLANYNFNKDLVIEKLYKVTDNPDESMIIFFENRFDYITKYMAEFFKLKGKLTNVTLNISNPEQGTIKLNTLPDNITNSKWTGKYYTDYEMTATAIPKEGYAFAGWKIEGAEIVGDKNSQTISIKLFDDRDCSIEAVFKKI